MPEKIDDRSVFSLREVALSIQKALGERYKRSFWVKAEMNKLNLYSYSGHCYPELVEKMDGRIVAQLKANLWKNDYTRINDRFLSELKEPLKDGITILFQATIGFDAVHGLSLRILDIDPVFSLGELEREKRNTMELLRREGIYDRNKKLPFPLLPKRIAIISVETSKGFADFNQVINNNPWGYKFFTYLFPALLQGDRSTESILFQLKRIKQVRHHFDVVAIIRGGGGDVGLSSYNHYQLSKEIAQFPIPVLTGIGHATNETVAEMVAHKNAITPTELADFLLQCFHRFAQPVERAREVIMDTAANILKQENIALTNCLKYFKSVTSHILTQRRNQTSILKYQLAQQSQFLLQHERQHFLPLLTRIKRGSVFLLERQDHILEGMRSDVAKTCQWQILRQKESLVSLEKTVQALDPLQVIKRGFSITLRNGKVIKSFSDVTEGDDITTITADGHIVSTVKKSNEGKEHE